MMSTTMSEEELNMSLNQYKEQLIMIEAALQTTSDNEERNSLLSLKSDMNQLIQLTQESLNAISMKKSTTQSKINNASEGSSTTPAEIDDEYALFMEEMAKSGAYEDSENNKSQLLVEKSDDDKDSDIEDELATLLGIKCAVYHTHKWGGQPTLYNAMVSSVEPRRDEDKFKDLQVRVLFTHPTHAEMLPCPFFLNGECRFDDEQCRYSHGAVVQLSDLKEAIEPDFTSVKVGSRVLVKLKPPADEDVSLARKSTEKYHLWHRATVKTLDTEKHTCVLKLDQGLTTGAKRKLGNYEISVAFEEIFPLNNDEQSESESDGSLSDTEYPESKAGCSGINLDNREMLVQKSWEQSGPLVGEWERHTRGIGSKLMMAMGYVPGTGLGAAADGRLHPVEARLVPLGKSLDHCMQLSEQAADRDPLKVEQKLKRLQKKEEDRNRRAYERGKERERRNVFNFLNRTLGDKGEETSDAGNTSSTETIKKSTNKDLNIEQFKITEETKKLERELIKLNSSLNRQASGSSSHKSLNLQILEKNKELETLKSREKQIAQEQSHRKDKHKMTVF